MGHWAPIIPNKLQVVIQAVSQAIALRFDTATVFGLRKGLGPGVSATDTFQTYLFLAGVDQNP